jgi:hypothetical protein
VPTRERGTATLGITVVHGLRRKANTTSTTRTIETISVSSTSSMEARIVFVRSSTTSRWTEGGIAARREGRRSRTRSTVSMMFAPGWRNITRRTAGWPLARPIVRRSSTESTTLATSRRRTAAPSWKLRTRSPYSRALNSWSVVPIPHALPAPETAPLGRLALAAASAMRTCSRLIP